MIGYRIIHCEFIYPPIPIRQFDYQATFDGYEPGCPIGHGATEQEAIDALHEAAEDEAEFAEWLRTPEGQKYRAEHMR
jgi:hypothetical protein